MSARFNRPQWLPADPDSPNDPVSDEKIHALLDRIGQIQGQTHAGKGAGTTLTVSTFATYEAIVRAFFKADAKSSKEACERANDWLKITELAVAFSKERADAFAHFLEVTGEQAAGEEIFKVARAKSEAAQRDARDSKVLRDVSVDRLGDELSHLMGPKPTTTHKFLNKPSREWLLKILALRCEDDEPDAGEPEDAAATAAGPRAASPDATRPSGGPEVDFFWTMWPDALPFAKSRIGPEDFARLFKRPIPDWYPGKPVSF